METFILVEQGGSASWDLDVRIAVQNCSCNDRTGGEDTMAHCVSNLPKVIRPQEHTKNGVEESSLGGTVMQQRAT
jgi:hypothetical protein